MTSTVPACRIEAGVRLLARRWLPVGEAGAADVAATTMSVLDGASPIAKLRALLGLVLLGFRLRSRAATDDDPRRIVTQGAGFTVAPVLALTALWVLGAGVEERLPVLAGLGVAFVAVSAALVGRKHGWWRRLRRADWLLGLGAVGVVTVAAPGAGPVWLVPAVVAVAAAAPVVVLALGWFDPRLAVAATGVWLWRLAAADLGQLVDELGRLGSDAGDGAFVFRWLVMATGVLVGAFVSQLSMARAAKT